MGVVAGEVAPRRRLNLRRNIRRKLYLVRVEAGAVFVRRGVVRRVRRSPCERQEKRRGTGAFAEIPLGVFCLGEGVVPVPDAPLG